MDEQHFRLLATLILDNQVVPFLGAGVNLCGRTPGQFFVEGEVLPSGHELASWLAREWRMAEGNVGLAQVSQHAVVLVGNGPLYNKLHRVFDHDFEPTDVHRFLATLPAFARQLGRPEFPLFITANYDDAFERAFADAGEPLDVVVYMEKGKHAGRFVHIDPSGDYTPITRPNSYEFRLDQRPCVIKIHGAIDRRKPEYDSFVITEDDYVEYVIKAGFDLAKVFPVDLLSKARNSHFLYLGYSLRDWNLRVILNRIEAERTGTYESWSVQLSATDLESRAWQRRGVEVILSDLQDYVRDLHAAIREEVAERR